jgi:hypothetical protein
MHKIILSAPLKGAKYTRCEVHRTGSGYQAALYTATQVFHENFDAGGLDAFTARYLGGVFTHYTAWDGEFRHSKRVTKKGKLLHSRTRDDTAAQPTPEKNHILREGMDIPFLVHLGVFTKEGKIAAAMRDKFIQINRFVELVADETRHLQPGSQLNLVDFGCGKSYLTFLLYHYFEKMRGLQVRMAGMDSNAELVQKCNDTAAQCGFAHLEFVTGSIDAFDAAPVAGWGAPGSFNMAVCLHACDTATDFALHKAILWNADLICAVPCCQHEVRNQMRAGNKNALALFSRHGIIEERVAALVTDAVRAAILESRGYRVSAIELTDAENTAKNIMLRGAKTDRGTEHSHAALREAKVLIEALGVEPALWRLVVNAAAT